VLIKSIFLFLDKTETIMTTSHSLPLLMRVISASLTLAKRAGQIIKDVQMSGKNLDIVDKV
jgi:hypothetical protein